MIIDPATNKEVEVKEAPKSIYRRDKEPAAWQKDMRPGRNVVVDGHWFKTVTCDPNYPDLLVLAYIEPTSKTKKLKG